MIENNSSLLPLLQQLFGYESFREGQEEIIKDTLAGKNIVALLPTGAGKSLCYQFPARLQNGLTIVISPLLSLMEDQMNELILFGEKRAAALNSMRTYEERIDVYKKIRSLKILFVSPEMLQSEKLIQALQTCLINRVVVDEAHCITQWGHEFRRDYRKLGNVLQKIGNPPVLAVTATASKETLSDIVSVLRIEDPVYHLQTMNRPSIAMSIKRVENEDEKLQELLTSIQHFKGNGIVYCTSRAITEGLFHYLQNEGMVDCAFYHGGVSTEQRILLQNQFKEGQIRILLATSAFGMGINKKDIRFVIHYGVPPFLENYLQEIGRAGRDGLPSIAHMIFTENDFNYSYSMIERELPTDKETLQMLKVIATVSDKRSIFDDEWVTHFLQANNISDIHWRYTLSLLEEYGVINNENVQSFELQTIYKRFVEVRNERLYNKSNEVKKMIEVCTETTCIRERVLAFFGETIQTKSENCCSVCGIAFEQYYGKTENVHAVLTWEERLKELFHIASNE